jgi:hypothetical protein
MYMRVVGNWIQRRDEVKKLKVGALKKEVEEADKKSPDLEKKDRESVV